MTNKRRNATIGGAIAILTLCATWLWLSPAWTLGDMRDAARRGDTATMDAHIDYAALRNDLKTQMADRLRREARQGAGTQLAMALGMGAIDAMVTPERLREMIAGSQGGDNGMMRDEGVGIDRTGLTQFVAGKTAPDGVHGGAVFTLQGVTWRITAIRIPDATSAPVEAPPATLRDPGNAVVAPMRKTPLSDTRAGPASPHM